MLTENETRALEQAQKLEALGSLAGGVAHDINNILAAILGHTELAMTEMEACGADSASLREVLKGVERAEKLVGQILAYSRLDDGERCPVALHEVMRGAVRLLRASIPSRIAIREDIADSPQAVLGNETQLYQILLNLCANAVQAMPEGHGELWLQLRYPRGLQVAELTVRDRGCGIPEEVRTRIFDRFFTTKPDGTGMGLALVQEVVRRHGGQVSVESRVHEGAAFHISLPTVGLATMPGVAKDDVVAGGSETILLVDDEVSFTDVVAKVLRRLGYRVEVATNGDDALVLFQGCPAVYDVVVTDLSMPGLDGLALATQIHRVRPELPIVLTTGYGSTFSTERANAVGVSTIVGKPVNTRSLDRAIRRAVDGAAAMNVPESCYGS